MKTVFAPMLRIAAAAALALTASAAMAGGDVSWSVTVGSPYGGAYVQPPPVVYVEPRPVYVRPRPVYVQPAPVVTYGQPYYYVEAPGPRRHWRHHHHGYDRHGPHGRHGY